ncbi:MerR family transcriptional regulator [Shewanella sp. SNU WT4]|uniref:MerR family transcriptional regulator n=1 Tax=Shewanella sp. SNU WT4 TaxID=2590015 RepID=UPI00143DFE0F|nr:MerR family transcriptional regulator [Shewanella sp. SNU WT4]
MIAHDKFIHAERFSIGEVSKMTGVNSITLRAWQRRFGLLVPERTPKGHRLYSQADIELIAQIIHWLEAGVSISKIRPLLNTPQVSSYPLDNEWLQQQQALLHALSHVNASQLHHLLDEYEAHYPWLMLQQQLFEPWLRQLPQWLAQRQDGHGLSVWLKQQLDWRLKPAIRQKPSIAVLALPGSDDLDSWQLCWQLCQQGRAFVNFGSLPWPQIRLLAPRITPSIWLVVAGPKHLPLDIEDLDALPLMANNSELVSQQRGRYLVGQFAPLWDSSGCHQPLNWAELSQVLAHAGANCAGVNSTIANASDSDSDSDSDSNSESLND